MDCYAWIDPWEAVEAVKWAREDGRRDVLNYLAEAVPGGLLRAVNRALGELADRMAREVIHPELAATEAEVRTKFAMLRAQADASYYRMQPMIAQLAHNAEFKLSIGPSPTQTDGALVATVRCVRPFEYHIAIPPSDWR